MTIDGAKLRFPALVLATALVAITRFPNDGWIWTAVVPVLSIVVAGLGYSSIRDDGAPWKARVTVATFLGLLVVPPATEAVLSFLPGWIVVVVSLVALHHFYAGGQEDPPTVSLGDGSRSFDPRIVIVVVAVSLTLIMSPLMAAVLPARWGSLFAWGAATGPLIAGVLIAGALMCVVLIREGWARVLAAREDAGGSQG